MFLAKNGSQNSFMNSPSDKISPHCVAVKIKLSRSSSKAQTVELWGAIYVYSVLIARTVLWCFRSLLLTFEATSPLVW